MEYKTKSPHIYCKKGVLKKEVKKMKIEDIEITKESVEKFFDTIDTKALEEAIKDMTSINTTNHNNKNSN